jgi:hypothetical protein
LECAIAFPLQEHLRGAFDAHLVLVQGCASDHLPPHTNRVVRFVRLRELLRVRSQWRASHLREFPLRAQPGEQWRLEK